MNIYCSLAFLVASFVNSFATHTRGQLSVFGVVSEYKFDFFFFGASENQWENKFSRMSKRRIEMDPFIKKRRYDRITQMMNTLDSSGQKQSMLSAVHSCNVYDVPLYDCLESDRTIVML